MARLASAYLENAEDFLIDLIGYRRYGHNEGDEPAFTQPVMYKTIQQHRTARKIWADTLVERQQIDPAEPDELVKRTMDELQNRY
ncbi:MAG: thiamine pyrophosphate-dependent enzyme [Anaerolineae bacterium]